MFRLLLISSITALAFGRVLRTPAQILDLEGRIVGGRNATIEEFPYQLSFELNGGHRCGASLIKPNVAVTAAHCTEGVQSLVKYMSVRTGSTIRETGGQVALVISICDHPKYNFPDYDVSVLLLDRSFTLNEGTQLIPLQPVNSEVRAGTLATVTGWGYLSVNGISPYILQQVEVPKINDASCAAYYPGDDITSRMHCFGYDEGGKDSCQGDSGGPLVVAGKLVGVVTGGNGCAFPKNPGVYVKVAEPEIQDHINSCIANF